MTLADTISINGAPSMAKRVWRALQIFSAASTRNEVANTAGYDERERREFVYALEGAGSAGRPAIPHLEKIRRHLPRWSEGYDRAIRLILRSIRGG